MNRFKNLFTVFAFSLLVLGLPLIASAQWRNDRNNDDDYYGTNRNNRNLQSTLRNLKSRARQFERQLDRDLDNSRYDGRDREDRLNDMTEEFVGAAEELSDEYDNRGDYDRTQDEARRVLQLGSQLDRAVSRARLSSSTQNQWNQIRQDLRVIANAYNTNYDNGNNRNSRNNRNNRNNRNDDWRNRIPFPLPF
jgi:hypothetical protein